MSEIVGTGCPTSPVIFTAGVTVGVFNRTGMNVFTVRIKDSAESAGRVDLFHLHRTFDKGIVLSEHIEFARSFNSLNELYTFAQGDSGGTFAKNVLAVFHSLDGIK